MRASAAGDFLGNGRIDTATLFYAVSPGGRCGTGPAPPGSFHLRVAFGSGGGFVQRFDYCSGLGDCGATVFAAADIRGDGRSELVVEVGPGAAVDFLEVFAVNRDAVRPLRIAPPAAPRYGVRPGSAKFGGGFDSGSQSPVACRVEPDGNRFLVARQAFLVGARISGAWRVHSVFLRLRGNAFHVASVTGATVRGFPIGDLRFANGCA